MPSRIPQLSPNDLEIALQRIDLLAIPSAAKSELKRILRAASNPDTEKIETILKTLPKARQEEILRIFAEVEAMHKQQNDDAAKLLLLLGLVSLGGLLSAYLLTTDQQALQAGQLLSQMQRVWVEAIQDEIDYCGCNARARQASGADLAYLQQKADADAASIISTFNKDVQREIEKLFEQYPNASKDFYIQHMRAWQEKRSAWKTIQIAFNTETQTREYARSRFRAENFAETTRYIFTGPPAVCELCLTEFAAGIVDKAHVDEFPCPRHLDCPHQWRSLRKPKVDCATLWVG